jgi:hypothetical protein
MSKLSDFQKWKKWDQNNPHFYDLFKKFTFEAIQRGRKELSGWLVANRIRWETEVVTMGSEWKVPNGCIAYYTRMFMIEYPQHTELFETRPLKNDVESGVLEAWLYEREGLEVPAPEVIAAMAERPATLHA